jgi:galactokinase
VPDSSPAGGTPTVTAFAPGRINLIGEHTDHTGGLALPVAVDLGVTVTGAPGGDAVVLTSDGEPGVVHLPLAADGGTDDAAHGPQWGRYVAGVVAEVRPARGFTGTVSADLPAGVGLASSAALELAVALAVGFDGSATELALACQRAEQRVAGVPCGVLDQLASASGVAGAALLVDCTTLTVTPVPVPDGVELLVVHSGQARRLAASPYAERRAACEEAQRRLGPLRHADEADVATIDDPVLRRRARHVVRENARVLAASEALAAGDAALVGRIMGEGHASLRDDFEVSTPALDALVEALGALPGVYGARLTGAGFGGCAVALVAAGTSPPPSWHQTWWRVRAGRGASRLAR